MSARSRTAKVVFGLTSCQASANRGMKARQARAITISSSAIRRHPIARRPARARERVVPISELVFGTLTQNRSGLEPWIYRDCRHAAH
jgi:hypothetical protein